MTRDEAVAKVRASRVIGFNHEQTLVESLEALGLLKLEEPKPEWHGDVVEAVHKHPGLQYVAPISVIQALEGAGLKVVRA
jgi:hypothetical protein